MEVGYSLKMEVGYPFPPIDDIRRERELYENVLGWKRSDVPLDNLDKTLNCVGFADRSVEMKMLVEYFKSKGGEMKPREILDMLAENLNPDKIADERLYLLKNFGRIGSKNLSEKRLSALVELIEKDEKIEIYKIKGRRYIWGRDAPYVLELEKNIRRKDGRLKYNYPPIKEGVECIPADEFVRGAGLSIQRFRKLLHEHEELRKNIYVTITGKTVVKKEDMEELKKFVRAILQPV